MTASRKQSSPAVKACVYTRISSDPSGQRAGVERQRADCEAHCRARGWDVVEVFCDNDASAYGRKPRRAYERMLAAVESAASTPLLPGTTTACTAHPKSSRPSSISSSAVESAWPWSLEGTTTSRPRTAGCLRASLGPWPERSPRTAAAGCAASTSSSPSKVSPPASWVGRAQRRRAGAGPRGRQPSADGPWPHDDCSRLERARRARSV